MPTVMFIKTPYFLIFHFLLISLLVCINPKKYAGITVVYFQNIKISCIVWKEKHSFQKNMYSIGANNRFRDLCTKVTLYVKGSWKDPTSMDLPNFPRKVKKFLFAQKGFSLTKLWQEKKERKNK